jgi:hypothetical protein
LKVTEMEYLEGREEYFDLRETIPQGTEEEYTNSSASGTKTWTLLNLKRRWKWFLKKSG